MKAMAGSFPGVQGGTAPEAEDDGTGKAEAEAEDGNLDEIKQQLAELQQKLSKLDK